MFVLSVSSKNITKFLFILVCVCLATVVTASVFSDFKKNDSADKVNADASFSTNAKTAEDVLNFISQYGWKVDAEPIEIRDVVIPEEFDEVYTNYNKIQISQGFDMTDFAGKKVKRKTYTIKNYPGFSEEDDFIRINILIYDGKVIGGDVCSIKLDGFMHGFALEDV